MLNTNPYQQYRQTSIDTAGPEKLLLMLYDGAIKFLNQAQTGLNAGNIEESNRYLLKAQDIIDELIINLNMDAGEIAQNLFRLYDYYKWRLIEANIKKDAGIISEVAGHLTSLRNAWAEAAVKARPMPKEAARGMNIEA